MITTVNVLCYKTKTFSNGERPLMILRTFPQMK